MQEDDIKNYLTSNPAFFEKNASLLADIHLPSPHGAGTISLAERQQLAQRDKIIALEERYAELVLNAQGNDAIRDKMHAFFILLQQAKNIDELTLAISQTLPDTFNIAAAYLHVWTNPLNSADTGSLAFKVVSESEQAWVNGLSDVYCGGIPNEVNADDWLADQTESIAILPLKQASAYGYLALASDEKERFYASMGTDFLQKLGDHVNAALSRHFTA